MTDLKTPPAWGHKTQNAHRLLLHALRHAQKDAHAQHALAAFILARGGTPGGVLDNAAEAVGVTTAALRAWRHCQHRPPLSAARLLALIVSAPPLKGVW